MHSANQRFWEYFHETYDEYLAGKIIYEFGSHDVNDGDFHYPLRFLSAIASEYVGVDWREGTNVTLVSLAHEAKFDHPADAIVSASMFEHDPYWEQSITNMVGNLKPDGILGISWGAALNTHHFAEHSPEGEFCALPAGKLINKIRSLGMEIAEFQYESTRFGGGAGEVVLVAFNGAVPSNVSIQIDELLPEDLL